MVNVKIDNVVFQIKKGITAYSLYQMINNNEIEGISFSDKADIILCRIDNKLCELSTVIKNDCEISFIATDTFIGNECYRKSLTFMLIKAVYKVFEKNPVVLEVMNSLGDGYYIELKNKDSLKYLEISDEIINEIKEKMITYNKRDIIITKRNMPISDAKKLFDKYNMHTKSALLKYRISSTMNVYNMAGFEDYFYGYLAYSTGILKYFDLIKYKKGLILLFPNIDSPKTISKPEISDKLYEVFDKAHDWAKIMGGNNISQINEKVVSNEIKDLVLVQEALQEKNIAEIADKIASSENNKFVMIAGPSSSGKTSFSHRLAIQLRALGLRPHPIAMDNYFVNREDNPVDEDGNLDFEAVEAVDIEFFNKQMMQLRNGETIKLPTFDFINGKREFKGETLKLDKGDILIIEGIHCLNEIVSKSIDDKYKYKIYVSALTPLNIDDHNRISTSDLRLLRRMVRDTRTRGSDARMTINRWRKVREGEKVHIFPYQNEADVIFNSALLYELGVLKTYLQPELLSVSEGMPEFDEANRLLKFISYMVAIPDTYIPNNSILKEFIGGSIFPV